MVVQLTPPLKARNGHTLWVLFICRVSDPREGKQDERSLGDQETLLRRWLSQHTDQPLEVRVIAGDGSGERLDRPEVAEAESAVESRYYDLVLIEDLGRFLRRIQASLFCELAEDCGTRLIAINDSLDTGREDWRMCALFASFRHEQYNADTAKRIRRTLRSRHSQGGAFQRPIYGYIKPPDCKGDADVSKDPDAEPIYDEWFRRLENGSAFAEIADWLNASNIKPGPAAKTPQWDGRMVGRVTFNEILKGVRVRNNRMAKRVNATGRRKSVKAPPEDRLERMCPHLTFIEPDRYDRVIALLKERNKRYRRGREARPDVRIDVPKKRTRYPGQCIRCGICGYQFVFGGHGQTDHLMCDGARAHRCWNGATVDGPLAAIKISAAVLREIEALQGFDEIYLAGLQEEARQANASRTDRMSALTRDLVQTQGEFDNVKKFIRNGDDSPAIRADLVSLDTELRRIRAAISEEERLQVKQIELPSLEVLKEMGRTTLSKHAIDSFEFANVLRRLTPRIVVFPYRLVDGGRVVLRARFRLQLAELIPEAAMRELLRPTLENVLEVDLFEPPQRELFRTRVVAARRAGFTERTIAGELGLTLPAAQRAFALQRRMNELDIADAYQAVTEPPDDGKIKRHRHPRYRFDPLPGAGEI